jgi:pheromone shutdown protein TraB
VQDCTYVFDLLSLQMEKMEKTDEITYMIQTLSKTFPTLLETLVQERDQYMVARLRSDLPIMPLHSLSYISHWNA